MDPPVDRGAGTLLMRDRRRCIMLGGMDRALMSTVALGVALGAALGLAAGCSWTFDTQAPDVPDSWLTLASNSFRNS